MRRITQIWLIQRCHLWCHLWHHHKQCSIIINNTIKLSHVIYNIYICAYFTYYIFIYLIYYYIKYLYNNNNIQCLVNIYRMPSVQQLQFSSGRMEAWRSRIPVGQVLECDWSFPQQHILSLLMAWLPELAFHDPIPRAVGSLAQYLFFRKITLKICLLLIYVHKCLPKCVCVPYVCIAHRGQKRALDSSRTTIIVMGY